KRYGRWRSRPITGGWQPSEMKEEFGSGKCHVRVIATVRPIRIDTASTAGASWIANVNERHRASSTFVVVHCGSLTFVGSVSVSNHSQNSLYTALPISISRN